MTTTFNFQKAIETLNSLKGISNVSLVNVISYWAVEYDLTDSDIEELYSFI